MKIEYLDLDNIDDLTIYMEKYNEVYPEKLEYETLVTHIFNKKPYAYIYYFCAPGSTHETFIVIPFIIKKIKDTMYIIYAIKDIKSDYIEKFKHKLASYSYDEEKFENMNDKRVINGHINGFYEIITKNNKS